MLAVCKLIVVHFENDHGHGGPGEAVGYSVERVHNITAEFSEDRQVAVLVSGPLVCMLGDSLSQGAVICDERAARALDQGLEMVGLVVGGMEFPVKHTVVGLQGQGVAGKLRRHFPPPDPLIHCSEDSPTLKSDVSVWRARWALA